MVAEGTFMRSLLLAASALSLALAGPVISQAPDLAAATNAARALAPVPPG